MKYKIDFVGEFDDNGVQFIGGIPSIFFETEHEAEMLYNFLSECQFVHPDFDFVGVEMRQIIEYDVDDEEEFPLASDRPERLKDAIKNFNEKFNKQ